jgi:putative colanic acid biosynthesis UDP-glucose lipid carrier transferase
MRNRHKFTFIIFCFIADLVAVVGGRLMFLYFNAAVHVEWGTLLLSKAISITILTWLLSITYFRLYRVDSLFSLEVFYRNSWRSFLVYIIMWQAYVFISHLSLLSPSGSIGNLFELSFLLFYFLFSRVLFALILQLLKKIVSKPYTVAIWGFNKTSIELASQLEINSCFIKFIGIINENSSETYETKEDFKLGLSNSIHSASLNNIDEFYIIAKPEFITDLSYFFELGDQYCMRLKFVPDFSTISKVDFTTSRFDNFQVIKPRHEPLQNAYNRLIKRVFDLVMSILIIVFVLSWLYPILAFIIKKQSNGPVLFKQVRTGKKNEPFTCYKFRSMQANVADESKQAQKEDARITSIGKFIRRTSLDEMPQFFNVFCGDMSIVGPRPHMIQHTIDYKDQINDFMVRHFVKPGITGLAQVTGLRGETKNVRDMQRRVRADIDYVQNWSLIKDIKICFLTIIVTLKGDEKAF